MGKSSGIKFFLRRHWGLRRRMPRAKNRPGQRDLFGPEPQRKTVVPFDSLPPEVKRAQENARRSAGDYD